MNVNSFILDSTISTFKFVKNVHLRERNVMLKQHVVSNMQEQDVSFGGLET